MLLALALMVDGDIAVRAERCAQLVRERSTLAESACQKQSADTGPCATVLVSGGIAAKNGVATMHPTAARLAMQQFERNVAECKANANGPQQRKQLQIWD